MPIPEALASIEGSTGAGLSFFVAAFLPRFSGLIVRISRTSVTFSSSSYDSYFSFFVLALPLGARFGFGAGLTFSFSSSSLSAVLSITGSATFLTLELFLAFFDGFWAALEVLAGSGTSSGGTE